MAIFWCTIWLFLEVRKIEIAGFKRHNSLSNKNVLFSPLPIHSAFCHKTHILHKWNRLYQIDVSTYQLLRISTKYTLQNVYSLCIDFSFKHNSKGRLKTPFIGNLDRFYGACCALNWEFCQGSDFVFNEFSSEIGTLLEPNTGFDHFIESHIWLLWPPK